MIKTSFAKGFTPGNLFQNNYCQNQRNDNNYKKKPTIKQYNKKKCAIK